MLHGPRLSLLAVCLLAASALASRPSTVAELLEDDGEKLIKQMVSQQGGAGIIETTDVYSGKSAVKITPMQLYQRELAGWAYKIVEKPKVGEYRFIRFAWKAPGATGIMLQMHDAKDWNLRLTAGKDEPNWGSKFVGARPPDKWTVVTRDLFADFGERTIQGIALTVFGQQPGYFDHIYFGRSVEELDAIDATGLSELPAPALKREDLERLWWQLGGDDAPKSYLAFWTLVSAREQSVPFLRESIFWSKSPEAKAQIKKWIVELDSDGFLVRHQAFVSLQQHLDSAIDELKSALGDAPPESRMRIDELIKSFNTTGRSSRQQEVLKVLKNIGTPAAKALLKDMAEAQDAR